jgi:hypothetical protein
VAFFIPGSAKHLTEGNFISAAGFCFDLKNN